MNKVLEKGIVENINDLIDLLVSNEDILVGSGGGFILIEKLYPYDPVTGKNKQPLQFWSVTKELFNKLEKSEEIAVNFLGLYIWGRTTTDKEFNLNSVIKNNKIVKEAA